MTGKRDEKLELELSQNGGKLSVSGDGASRLANAIADFVSPVTEGFGLVGDSLNRYRIHRKNAAIAALERAKALMTERGQTPHPISPKILAPWIEGASAEDLNDENIVELWARVLAASPEDFDSATASFVDICKRIGRSEAKFLTKIINSERYLDNDRSLSIEDMIVDNAIDGFMRATLLGHLDGSDIDKRIDFDRLGRNLEDWPINIPGIVVIRIAAHSGGAGSYRDLLDKQDAISLQILAREGLVAFGERSYSESQNSIAAKYARGTELAYEFARQLYPDGLPEVAS